MLLIDTVERLFGTVEESYEVSDPQTSSGLSLDAKETLELGARTALVLFEEENNDQMRRYPVGDSKSWVFQDLSRLLLIML